MKVKIWSGVAVVVCIALIVAAFAFRLVRVEDGHLFLRTLEEDASELLSRPYFHFGAFAVTPISLAKALAYLLLLGFAARALSYLLERHVLARTKLDIGQRYSIRRVTQYVLFMIGLMIGLETVGLNIASLAVFGGALGIGIGFGLQETANNFIAGLILLFEKPVQVGDRIEVGDVDGQVVQIGARASWVKTNDNIVIIIPNSAFITKEVINWTYKDRRVRFRVPFGVSYRADPEQVRAVVLEVARADADVLDDPAPDVIFTGFGNSSIDFQLRIWTATKMHLRPILVSNLYYAIFRAFRENNIEIPFPQRDLHLRTADVPLPLQQLPPQ